ncbi:MAG: hypothetical protein U1A27_03040 [Phycisphaerae bacterium]
MITSTCAITALRIFCIVGWSDAATGRSAAKNRSADRLTMSHGDVVLADHVSKKAAPCRPTASAMSRAGGGEAAAREGRAATWRILFLRNRDVCLHFLWLA